MKVTVTAQLHDALADDAWTLYHEAFRYLNAYAVQRHLMSSKEFAEVMGDRRVRKYLCRPNARIAGLATYTNDLDAMPLISPAYFARRWPLHYRQRRIWYCGFVAVAEAYRRTTVFDDLVTAMWRVAAEQRGIIGLDVCSFNDETHHLSRAIGAKLDRLAGQPIARDHDVQTYRLYETPGAVA